MYLYTRWSYCRECRQSFAYTTPYPNGKPRQFCDLHNAEHKRAINAAKQERYRRAHKMEPMKPVELLRAKYHIAKNTRRTYCGQLLSKLTQARWQDVPFETMDEMLEETCETCLSEYMFAQRKVQHD